MNWLLKAVYGAALFSWITARLFTADYSMMIAELENEVIITTAQMQHVMDDLSLIKSKVANERRILKKLKSTRTALDHEVRMFSEMAESGNSSLKNKPKNTNLIKGWLSHRKNVLLDKIFNLQRYLQAVSRTTVLKK